VESKGKVEGSIAKNFGIIGLRLLAIVKMAYAAATTTANLRRKTEPLSLPPDL